MHGRLRFPRSAITTSILVIVTGVSAGAQLPGLPVFQNAFANPGMTAAVNYGRASEVTAFALAGAWAPGTARFQISGGVGSVVPDGPAKSDIAYGGRLSMAIRQFGGGGIGVGAFGGVGAASKTSLANGIGGVSLGYRRPLGAGGIAAFVSPYYLYSRQDIDGSSSSSSLVRAGVGIDVSFFEKFGITVGADLGGKPEVGRPGPTSSIFGVGVSYAFRRG